MRSRRALTRLELLVLLALLAAGAGLFLAFVGRQRENAHRQLCALNLKRIGEATLGFHESFKFLPAARIAPGYATWAVQIAPYLDKDSPLAQWDLGRRFAEQAQPAREAIMKPYFCPARNRTSWLTADEVAGALGDYACASGDGDPQRPWSGPRANGAMILGEVLEEKDGRIARWQGRTNLAALTRGQSYTIIVGDKHVPLDQLGQAAAGDGAFFDGGEPSASARIGGPGHGLARAPTAPFQNNFGSAHLGICQILHADASVKPYASSMSEEVLGQLVRRDP